MDEDTIGNTSSQEEPTPAGPPVRPAPPPPPPPSPPRRPSSPWKWLIPVSLTFGCLPWVILVIVAAGGMVKGFGDVARRGEVALIRVTGVITAGRSGGGFLTENIAGSEDIVKQLERARKDRSVRAIVLRINSPGGSAAGSEEVYRAIKRVRRSGKPVFASMGDVAASGGYYIASASSKIYADSNTLTGSIGVIMSLSDLSDLYKKIGYKPETVKAGKFKDIGSPDRPLTAEERKILQGLVDNTYANFTQAVADGRKMKLEEVRKLAEGIIYTGDQAKKVKLIDEIGGLHETVRAAASAAGVRGEPGVVEYGRRGSLMDMFIGETEETGSRLEEEIARRSLGRFLNRGVTDGAIR